MGVSVERNGDLCQLVARGEYGVEELFHAFEALVQDVRSASGAASGLVVDVRESESLLRRPPDQTRRIISHFKLHGSLFQNRVAIVVEGHGRYGLMRMATTWAALAGYEARVFWNLRDAVGWLDGPSDASAPAPPVR